MTQSICFRGRSADLIPVVVVRVKPSNLNRVPAPSPTALQHGRSSPESPRACPRLLHGLRPPKGGLLRWSRLGTHDQGQLRRGEGGRVQQPVQARRGQPVVAQSRSSDPGLRGRERFVVFWFSSCCFSSSSSLLSLLVMMVTVEDEDDADGGVLLLAVMSYEWIPQ